MKKFVVGCAVLSLYALLCSPAPVASQPGVKSGGKTKIAGPTTKGAPEAPRIRWEYSVLTKEEVAKAGKDDFRAGLNKLGEEGWELVTIETQSLVPRAQPVK